MKVFNIPNNQNFSKHLASFYLEKIGEENFAKTVIFLPNHRLKKQFYETIAESKKAAVLLPKIFSLGDINQIVQEFLNITANEISQYERTLVIANILKQNFANKIEEENLYNFATKISNLLSELDYENSEVENLEKLFLEKDLSAFSQEIIDIIKQTQHLFQAHLKENNFTDKQDYNNLLTKVSSVLKQQNYNVIIAGTNASHNFIKNFIESFKDYTNFFFFFANFSNNNFFHKRLKEDVFKNESFTENTARKNLKVIEFENNFEELVGVINIIHQNFHEEKTIAVITPNYFFAKQVYDVLKEKGVYANLVFSLEIINNQYVRQIFNYLSFLETYDLNKKILLFLSLIKSINFNEALELENTILRENFINSFEDLALKIINKDFLALLEKEAFLKENNFSLGQFFAQIMTLFPNSNNTLNDFFDEIIALNNTQFSFLEKVKILKQIILSKTVNLPQLKNASVTILSPVEARLMQFDSVILANLNEDEWNNQPHYLWAGKAVLNALNLNRILNFTHLTNHDLDWHSQNAKENIFITRAKNLDASPWLIKFISDNKITVLNYKTKPIENKNFKGENLIDKIAVKTLSVSSIKTLLSNPFKFYLEKILKLYEKNDINFAPDARHFGKLFHKSIELFYSENIAAINSEIKLYPPFNQIIWQEKIFTKLQSFQKLLGQNIFETVYKTNVQSIEINGKFDHLNILGENFSLIDYKTGKLASKNEVTSFAEPQVQILLFLLLKNNVISLKNNPQFAGYIGLKDDKEVNIIKEIDYSSIIESTEENLKRVFETFFNKNQVFLNKKEDLNLQIFV